MKIEYKGNRNGLTKLCEMIDNQEDLPIELQKVIYDNIDELLIKD